MKIGIKLIIFWIASLALFAGVVVVSQVFPEWLNGVQGIFICFFLGYCAIIVVAQAFALMEIIRRQRANSPAKRRKYQTEVEST